jgi:hypothetical protein
VRDARVACAIASSPPRFVHDVYLHSEHGQRFAADIARAQQALTDGEPERLIEALIPQTRPFSARTYLDKYGPRARFDYFQYLADTPRPLLLTLGSLECEDISFAPLAARGPSMHAEWSSVTYTLVNGADHMYTHTTDQLWAAVHGWLQGIAAPVAR